MFYVSKWPMYTYKNISLYNTRSYIIYGGEGETLQHGYIYNKSLYLSSICCGKNFLPFFQEGGSLYNRSRSEPRSIYIIYTIEKDISIGPFVQQFARRHKSYRFFSFRNSHSAQYFPYTIYVYVRSCRSIGVFLVV
jgi:hypothetical protein